MLLNVRRRNWSSRGRRYRHANAFFVSIPKSGRTWLRFFLYSYFCSLQHRPLTLDEQEIARSAMPKFYFTHDLWEHWALANFKDRIRGKCLVPRRPTPHTRIIVLTRDPRDVVVSLFFQMTKRDQRFQGSLSEMIRHPTFGIDLIVDIMNTWMETWGWRNNFALLRYGDFRSDPEKEFRALLAFLGFHEIDDVIFAESLEASNFENMKTVEASNFENIKTMALSRKVRTGTLLPGDIEDPESFKVRRGIVGGYKDYLALDDMDYLNKAITRLHARYGYHSEKEGASLELRAGRECHGS